MQPKTFLVEPLEERMLLSTANTVPTALAIPNFTVGAMLADPGRNIVYLLDQTDQKVMALDTDLGRATTTADLAGSPTALAVSTDDAELYVTMHDSNQIQVFSLPDLTALRTLHVPSPSVIAAGINDMIYVCDTGQVRQIDGHTGALSNTIAASASTPRTSPDGTRLFLNSGNSTASVTEYDVSGAVPVLKGSFTTDGYYWDSGSIIDYALNSQCDQLYAARSVSQPVDAGMPYTVDGLYAFNTMTSDSGPTWKSDGCSAVALAPGSPYVWGSGSDSHGNFHNVFLGYSSHVKCFDRTTGNVIASFNLDTACTNPDAKNLAVSPHSLQVTPNDHAVFLLSSSVTKLQEIGIVGLSSLLVGVKRCFAVSDDTNSPLDRSLDLPSMLTRQTSQPQTFTLSSAGSESVTVSKWAASGEGFSVVVRDNLGNVVDISGKSFVIPSLASYTATVTITSAKFGYKTGGITFKTDDPNNPLVKLTLDAQVVSRADLTISLSQVAPLSTNVFGDQLAVMVTVTNVGTETAVASGRNPVEVDYIFDNLNQTLLSIPCTIAPGATFKRLVRIPLLSDGQTIPGSYTITANLNYDFTIATNYQNDTAQLAPLDVTTQFGTIPGRSGNVPLVYTDANGTEVRVTLTGGGYGKLIDNGAIFSTTETTTPVTRDITVAGSTTASRLEIHTRSNGVSSGRLSLDDLTVGDPANPADHTSLGTLQAATTDIHGSIRVAGTLGSASLGNVSADAGVIGIGAPDPAGRLKNPQVSLRFQDVTGLSVQSAIRIAALTAWSWAGPANEAGTITAPSLGTLQIGGGIPSNPTVWVYSGTSSYSKLDFIPNLNLTGPNGGTASIPTLQDVRIAGNMESKAWSVSGSIGRIQVSGDIGSFYAPWSLNNVANIGDIRVAENLYATTNATGTLGSLVAQSATWTGNFLGTYGNIGVVKLTGNTLNEINLHANAIGTLNVCGDLGSSIQLSQVPDRRQFALGTLIVSRSISGQVRSAGNIGTVTAAKLDGCWLFAGVKDSVAGLPATSADFDNAATGTSATIGCLRLTGDGSPASPVLVNASVAAASIGSVFMPRLAPLSTDPTAEPFGFATHTSITRYAGPRPTSNFMLRVL